MTWVVLFLLVCAQRSLIDESAQLAFVISTEIVSSMILQVAVPVPGVWAYDYVAATPTNDGLGTLFDDSLPDAQEKDPQPLAVGALVEVPLGKRQVVGLVLEIADDSSVAPNKLRPIARVLPHRLPATLVRLITWASRYYRTCPGLFLHGVLPAAIRHGKTPTQKKILQAVDGYDASSLTQRQGEVLQAIIRLPATASEVRAETGCSDAVLRKLLVAGAIKAVPESVDREYRMQTTPEVFPLNDEQKVAVNAVRPFVEQGKHEVFCLFGVTGSGKTLVFRELALAAQAAQKQVLILLPEIGLTPQAAARYRHALPDLVVWHSGFSDGQRALAWQQVVAGASCVLGTRSALFAPLDRLGLIIIDEEHDGSYKQDSTPRYHARDLAVMYGRQLGVPVVLGSATPSLETYANVQQKRYRLLRLLQRPAGSQLPTPTVIDMAEVFRAEGKQVSVAPALIEALRAVKAAGEQAIILLNRRGWAPQAVCSSCGTAVECPSCAVTLTYHRQSHSLRCHYCGYHRPFKPECPSCGQPDLATRGIGTEQLAAILSQQVAGLRVRRLDADVAGGREAHVKLLSDFAAGNADCLVGTQMVAKGLDFPLVTLVGLVAADAALAVPDFRAAERCYQLVAQVAGRAGRGERPGRVIVQAFDTEATAIQCALNGQARPFYQEQMRLRETYGYPPHGALVRLIWRGVSLAAVAEAAEAAVAALRHVVQEMQVTQQVTVLGASEAGLAYLQGDHRWHVLIKGASRGLLQQLLDRCPEAGVFRLPNSVNLSIDVDPMAIS